MKSCLELIQAGNHIDRLVAFLIIIYQRKKFDIKTKNIDFHSKSDQTKLTFKVVKLFLECQPCHSSVMGFAQSLKLSQGNIGMYRQSPIFFFQPINANMATFHHSETACPHFSNSHFQSDKIDFINGRFISEKKRLTSLIFYLSRFQIGFPAQAKHVISEGSSPRERSTLWVYSFSQICYHNTISLETNTISISFSGMNHILSN